jgi:hypothetical protein
VKLPTRNNRDNARRMANLRRILNDLDEAVSVSGSQFFGDYYSAYYDGCKKDLVLTEELELDLNHAIKTASWLLEELEHLRDVSLDPTAYERDAILYHMHA